MMIDKRALEEFKKLYEEEFKEEISDREAEERFRRLLTVIRVIAAPFEKPGGH